MEKQKKQEPKSTIRDGHELKALEHTEWGSGSAERAAEAVIGWNGDTHCDGKRGALRFFVNYVAPPIVPGEAKGVGHFEGWMPYRRITYIGATEGEVIGAMLHGVARLAYDGSMHPDRPSDMGAPPIQHVINILTDRLKWQTERRGESVRDLSDRAGPGEHLLTTKSPLSPSLDRNNQIIAALGTAIAALGRVNDL